MTKELLVCFCRNCGVVHDFNTIIKCGNCNYRLIPLIGSFSAGENDAIEKAFGVTTSRKEE